MQLHEVHERLRSLGLGVLGIVRDGLDQLVVGFEGGVVLQHVKDVMLVDSLAHGIQVEGMRLAVFAHGAEQLQGLGLGRRGEGDEGKVVAPALGRNLLQHRNLRGLRLGGGSLV